MMSNQTVHKLAIISLLNYIINITKSDVKPNSFTVFRDGHFENLLDSHINTSLHHNDDNSTIFVTLKDI